MEMTCPKCQGEMRHYERSGVTVDQCTECRGIFLDRGELERLIDAEAAWQNARGAPAAAPAPQARYEQPRYDDRRHDDRRHDDRHYDERRHDDHDYRKRKKKESFFEQLFD
jgi:Zn-finger nucleic acid-binding protein